MLEYSDNVWSVSPPSILKIRNYFKGTIENENITNNAAISLMYEFKWKYTSSNGFTQFGDPLKFVDFENKNEILQGFYDAMFKEDCSSAPIRLPRAYSPVVHL